jgi:hypothetical protein
VTGLSLGKHSRLWRRHTTAKRRDQQSGGKGWHGGNPPVGDAGRDEITYRLPNTGTELPIHWACTTEVSRSVDSAMGAAPKRGLNLMPAEGRSRPRRTHCEHSAVIQRFSPLGMPQIGRSLAYLVTSQVREPTNRIISLPVTGVATKEQLLVPTTLLKHRPSVPGTAY